MGVASVVTWPCGWREDLRRGDDGQGRASLEQLDQEDLVRMGEVDLPVDEVRDGGDDMRDRRRARAPSLDGDAPPLARGDAVS